MATLMAVSLLAGGYLATFALQKLKRFNLILAVCVLGGAAGHLLCWFLPDGPQTWIFLIMGGLIMGGGILMCVGRSPLIPLTGEISHELVGTVSGAFQVIKGVIAFFVPILIASICGTNFSAVFICFAVLCVIAFLTGAVFVPELGAAGKLFKEAEAKKKSIT